MKFSNEVFIKDLIGRDASATLLEGTLYHRKKSKKKEFKIRWFKLRANLLFYYRTNPLGLACEDEPKGLLVLTKCEVVVGDQNSFLLKIGNEEHQFRGISQEDIRNWVRALQTSNLDFLKSKLKELKKIISLKNPDIKFLGVDDEEIIPRMYEKRKLFKASNKSRKNKSVERKNKKNHDNFLKEDKKGVSIPRVQSSGALEQVRKSYSLSCLMMDVESGEVYYTSPPLPHRVPSDISLEVAYPRFNFELDLHDRRKSLGTVELKGGVIFNDDTYLGAKHKYGKYLTAGNAGFQLKPSQQKETPAIHPSDEDEGHNTSVRGGDKQLKKMLREEFLFSQSSQTASTNKLSHSSKENKYFNKEINDFDYSSKKKIMGNTSNNLPSTTNVINPSCNNSNTNTSSSGNTNNHYNLNSNTSNNSNTNNSNNNTSSSNSKRFGVFIEADAAFSEQIKQDKHDRNTQIKLYVSHKPHHLQQQQSFTDLKQLNQESSIEFQKQLLQQQQQKELSKRQLEDQFKSDMCYHSLDHNTHFEDFSQQQKNMFHQHNQQHLNQISLRDRQLQQFTQQQHQNTQDERHQKPHGPLPPIQLPLKPLNTPSEIIIRTHSFDNLHDHQHCSPYNIKNKQTLTDSCNREPPLCIGNHTATSACTIKCQPISTPKRPSLPLISLYASCDLDEFSLLSNK